TATGHSDDWDFEQLWTELKTLFPISLTIDEVISEGGTKLTSAFLVREVLSDAKLAYERREESLGHTATRELERRVVLSVVDRRWRDHLYEMDYLKDGIGLRAMGQRDPITEYKQEAFEMFGNLVKLTNEDFIRTIMHIQVLREDPAAQAAPARNISYSAPSESSIFAGAAAAAAAAGPEGPSPDQIAQASAAAGGRAASTTVVKDKEDPFADVGRNDPCPCGSGKKYKKCHGANA
ncbi:MAG: SEC-C metal-binding domain-containing protein, partial [Coriobacteriia bacterium]|nr:SEC-C metal-binding domain-containing protein [Coriobacteriia bacterium]